MVARGCPLNICEHKARGESAAARICRPVNDVAFVFNPSAQTGQASRRWDEITRLAGELEIAFERFDTRPDGETVALVADLTASRRFRTVVAFGGDGTIHEVVSGIMAGGEAASLGRDDLPALAVVPFGTGNNIAKSFGLEPNGASLRRALETIRYGADFRLDLGRIDERWMVDGFSIGVDPAVLNERNVEREKAKRSPLLRSILRDYNLYAYAFLRVPLRHRNVAARVWLDDEAPLQVDHLTNLIVNNVRVYAGEFVFEPESRANDGLLDVILFRGWHEYLSKFISAARISPVNPRVIDKLLERRGTVRKARRIRIETAWPVDAQVDGEMLRRGHTFEVTCVPDALNLKTPVG